MKKILVLLLAAVMCLSLAACRGGSKDDIYLKAVGDGYYLNFPNSKVFEECIIKVDITQDNWHEYFEDYEYTEHIKKTNDFGDVEEEYDVVHRGFGLKQSIVGLVDTLTFKFDGITEYLSSGYKVVKKANQQTYNIYSCATNELVKREQLAENQVADCYIIEFSNSSRGKIDIHLEEHTFIDVIGTIYIIDIPEGIYNGEDIWQIDFGPDGANGGTGFGIGNILLYYEA